MLVRPARLSETSGPPDQLTIEKILEDLGLTPPEIERPPPDVRSVPLDHEGREIDATVAEERRSPPA